MAILFCWRMRRSLSCSSWAVWRRIWSNYNCIWCCASLAYLYCIFRRDCYSRFKRSSTICCSYSLRADYILLFSLYSSAFSCFFYYRSTALMRDIRAMNYCYCIFLLFFWLLKYLLNFSSSIFGLGNGFFLFPAFTLYKYYFSLFSRPSVTHLSWSKVIFP